MMKLALTGLAVVMVAALGACGSQSDTKRAQLREQMSQLCNTQMAPALTQQMPGMNTQQLCGCLADKVGNLSDAQIADFEKNKGNANTFGQQAAMECVTAQMGNLKPGGM